MILTLLFSILALVILGAALMVIVTKHPVHSIIYLLLALAGVAIVFLSLEAEFLAAVQILVYAGGIVVLFLFVIMFAEVDEQIGEIRYRSYWILSGLCALLLILSIGYVFMGWTPPALPAAEEARELTNTQQIGVALYNDYLIPFEIVSVLLLAAMIGAITLAKK